MTNKKTVSAGQIMLILVLARIMHTMIFQSRNFTNGVPLMLGLLAATAIEAILAVPAVIYISREGSFFDSLGRFAPYVKLLYSLYFLVIASATVSLFTGFLRAEFSETAGAYMSIVLISLASAYCAHLGIEGLSRAATAVFWLFAVTFAIMAAVNEGGFEWLNITPMTRSDLPDMLNYLGETLSSAWWLPMLLALSDHLKSGAAKAAYGYLALKLIIIEVLLLLMSLVLWRYVDILGYPIFALGAYAKSDFIQRFDAINMLVWAINCVIVAAVYIFIISKPAKSEKKGIIPGAVATGLLAALFYRSGLRFDEKMFLVFKAAGVLLLGVVLPLVLLIKSTVSRRKI